MKTNLTSRVANAARLSFAHLGAIGRAVSAKAEESNDDDEKPKKDKEDEASSGRAESEDDGDDKPKKDAKAEDDDKDDDDKPKKDSKASASKDAEDDDKDEEMRGGSDAASARLREQARCAAIFASPAAAKNPVLAANLAFTTRMTRSEAVAILEATPSASAVAPINPNRASKNPSIGADGGAKQSPEQAALARWDANLSQAMGRARKA